MGRRRDPRAVVEHGDFQTPPALAAEVCRVLAALLAARGATPAAIVEPTCGTGALLFAALDAFPAARALGADINADHLAAVHARGDPRVEIAHGSFFAADWPARLRALPQPLLAIGNPPWVTSADLGALASANLPPKSNFQRRRGLEAVTGSGNFDISEWIIATLLDALAGRDAVLAMLCKAAVARKVLAHAWRSPQPPRAARCYQIDAQHHFGAAVEACLLVCELGPAAPAPAACVAPLFASTTATTPAATLGFRDGAVVADVVAHDRWRHLAAARPGDPAHRWRSGIKHDCAAVMELHRRGAQLETTAGEPVDLEDELVFPMLKSSEVARAGAVEPTRWMVVTQRAIGDDTAALRTRAPRTWRYLERHAARLARRASSIYRGKPAFAMFGIGPYAFAPWKVAISGLYKQLAFRVVGPHAGRPVVLDDTCYFLPCETEAEARRLHALLGSPPATAFYTARVFWDAKRPITSELLGQLDLRALAAELATP